MGKENRGPLPSRAALETTKSLHNLALGQAEANSTLTELLVEQRQTNALLHALVESLSAAPTPEAEPSTSRGKKGANAA